MRILTRGSWLTWLVIAFGALWALSNVQDISSVNETARWPTTPGTIVDSHIASEEVGTYVGKSSNRPMYASRLHLTYVYDVDGRRYTGSRWSALPPSANQATHAMLRKYPSGGAVVVHYDPGDPTSAVLDTSRPIGRYIQFACGLVIACWGVVLRYRPTFAGRAPRSWSAASRGA